jgi:hypothetical protein
VSVTHPNQSSSHYHIQVVIVELSAPAAAALRERFYARQPDITKQKYPYVGRYTFVPFLPSKEWTVDTIYNLARLHMKLITNLTSVYIHNVQDIRNVIHPSGITLYQGFLSMLTREEANVSGQGPQQLLESGSEEGDHLPKRTRLLSITMSYKTAATGDQVDILQFTTQLKLSITSTYTDEDLSTLFSRMQQKFGTPTGEHVSTADLETYYDNSKQELKLLEAYLQYELGSLNSKVDSLQEGLSMQQNSIMAIQAEMGKQNTIMISMHSDFLQAMQAFSEKLIALHQQVTNPATPAAAISKNQHWGALGS